MEWNATSLDEATMDTEKGRKGGRQGWWVPGPLVVKKRHQHHIWVVPTIHFASEDFFFFFFLDYCIAFYRRQPDSASRRGLLDKVDEFRSVGDYFRSRGLSS